MRDNISALCKKAASEMGSSIIGGGEGGSSAGDSKAQVRYCESEVAELHKVVEEMSDIGSSIVNRLNKAIFTNSSSKSCSRCFKTGTDEEVKASAAFCSRIFQHCETSSQGQSGIVEENLSEFRICKDDDSVEEGSYKVFDDHKKIPHGVFRKINEFGDVEFFGIFYNGNLAGRCWKSLPGGGMLISSRTDFSGEDTAFLYPDIRTAMVGKFSEEGRMLQANLGEVAGIRKPIASHGCDQGCRAIGTLYPVFTISNETDTFRYDKSTGTHISSDPKLRDPYERHFVRIGKSRIPMAGQGLFAKNRIEPFTVVAFYNGVRSQEEDYVDDGSEDDEESEDDQVLCDKYRYRLKLSAKEQLDVPKEMASIDKYNATLAHKIQHSFTPNCEMDDFEHPRFGDIKCVATLRPVKAGEELTIHYQYQLNTAPIWYKKQWARHQKRERRMPDWQTALNRHSKVIPAGFIPTSTSTASTSSSSSASGAGGRLSRPGSQCFAILEELENDEFALNFADDENGDETSSVASFF